MQTAEPQRLSLRVVCFILLALFVLGFPEALGEIAYVRRDDTGLLLDTERLPKRVRIKKVPPAL